MYQKIKEQIIQDLELLVRKNTKEQQIYDFRMIILPGNTAEENIQYMFGREKGIRYTQAMSQECVALAISLSEQSGSMKAEVDKFKI